jgi:predicted transposase/invertase (TIGR01784 family)
VIEDNSKTDIEVQLTNEYNMERRSLHYWAREYSRGISEGRDYGEMPKVIVINILDFVYIPLEEFYTSFHIYEDRHKEYMLTDALEMRFIEVVKWRRLKDKDMNNPLHRWMTCFDEQSPAELIEEVLSMDTAIRAAQEKMALIMRDPGLLHAYDLYEQTRMDYQIGIKGARLEGERKGRLAGIQEGRLAGIQEGRREMARNMKADGEVVEKIIRYTGLSTDEIARL